MRCTLALLVLRGRAEISLDGTEIISERPFQETERTLTHDIAYVLHCVIFRLVYVEYIVEQHQNGIL